MQWCLPYNLPFDVFSFGNTFFPTIKQSRDYQEELLNWWIFLRFVGLWVSGLYKRPRDDTAIYMHPTEIFQLIISDQNKTVFHTFVWVFHVSCRNKSFSLLFFLHYFKHFCIREPYKSREINQQTKIRGTQPENSSKSLQHSIFECILVFKRRYRHIFVP